MFRWLDKDFIFKKIIVGIISDETRLDLRNAGKRMKTAEIQNTQFKCGKKGLGAIGGINLFS